MLSLICSLIKQNKKYFLIGGILFIHFNLAVAVSLAEGNSKTQLVPMIDGISSRLRLDKNETMTIPSSVFSFGVFKEYLGPQASQQYSAKGLGVSFGFQQHIRGFWNGGIEMRWSDWSGSSSTSTNSISPLGLYSKVEADPPSFIPILGDYWGQVFKPYATFGFGYTLFFDSRSPSASRSRTALGEMSATGGAGLRLTIPQSFGVKIGYEYWRGIQTSSYDSNLFLIQFLFGDVDNL